MLTLDDIIKYINIPQKKIKGKSKDQLIKLPDVFHTLHKTFKDCHYIKNNGNFYNTFLTLIDPNFIMSANKPEIIRDLRKKLWEKIEKSFKDYCYNRKRKFNKASMMTELLDFSNEIPTDIIMKYIVDFFGINVYILNENLTINHILATDEGAECIFKPCIIIFKDDDCYYPVLIGDKTIFVYSKDDIVKDLYEKFVPRKASKTKKPKKEVDDDDCKPVVEDVAEAVEKKPAEEKPNVDEPVIKRKAATTKMSLEELQALAQEYEIDISKKKGEKDVNKTKKELYDDINSFISNSV